MPANADQVFAVRNVEVREEMLRGRLTCLTYRDGQGHAATAAALGCSVRIAYLLPAARTRLAAILDRLDLP